MSGLHFSQILMGYVERQCECCGELVPVHPVFEDEFTGMCESCTEDREAQIRLHVANLEEEHLNTEGPQV